MNAHAFAYLRINKFKTLTLMLQKPAMLKKAAVNFFVANKLYFYDKNIFLAKILNLNYASLETIPISDQYNPIKSFVDLKSNFALFQRQSNNYLNTQKMTETEQREREREYLFVYLCAKNVTIFI